MDKPSNQVHGSAPYRAFISYSHDDKAVATWLHKTLERYKLPKKLVGTNTKLGLVPKRLSPIFRDQDELPASGNLGRELQLALENSLFLIVLCSPFSAKSKWVNEEVFQFKKLHGSDRVLALIVDGEPNAAEAENECFVPALKWEIDEQGKLSDKISEPIAADLRKNADGKRLAVLKLISGLTTLRLDNLVQREATRRMQALVQISVGSLSVAIFAAGLALYANEQRIEANAQREIAKQEAANARAVSDFLVESFTSANSQQVNPNDVTARSILDRGAERLATDLQNQPLIQSKLSEVIALAFNNLGLFDASINVIDSITMLSGIASPIGLVLKAEAHYRKGEIDTAMQITEQAKQIVQNDGISNAANTVAKINSDLARIQGLIYYKRGDLKAGLSAFDTALQELEKMPEKLQVVMAGVLQTRALLLSDMGEMEKANADLDRAKSLALEVVDKQDILIGQITLAQAQVNFLSWNLAPALEQITFALQNMQEILEDDNPALADALSMQGQIMHALGDLDNAYNALTKAVNIYTQAFNGRHYLSGIAEVYLGLISGDRKDLDAALCHFQEAKLHYDKSYGQIHANHGDLLVNQATVLASMGELTRAKEDCAAGIIILNDTLGPEAAFTQQLQAMCDDIYQQQN